MPLAKNDIVYAELSYQIMGATFRVYNTLGWGFSESHYQMSLEKELEKCGLDVRREVYLPLKYQDKTIAKSFADFIVENKIVLELKVVSKLGYANVKQVYAYLKSSGIKLGILIYFTRDGIKYRRVLNSSA